MIVGFPSLGFLNELTSRFQIFSGSQASVEGFGQQAVVVAAGDRVYKVFASSARHCGVTAHNREVAALDALGGYEGQAIRTPELKSHIMFESPFEILGKSFVGMIEQTRMSGVKPNPTTPYQYADIGFALGEFHQLLDGRSEQLAANHNIIAHRMGLLKDKDAKKGHVVLPGARKKILGEASKLALDTTSHRYVHGDFHMGNTIFDGQRFAIIDLATIGRSLPEQDMTALVGQTPETLKEVFKGYCRFHHKKPSLGRVMTLHKLDLAIAAELAHTAGRPDHAQRLVDRLQAVMG